MDGDDRLDAMQATQVVQPTSGEENMLEQVVTPEPPRPHRPRNRTQADFRDLEDPRLRHAALKEYNRTLEEFRQTGTVENKEWGDFAHLINPPSLRSHVFKAHCQASLEVGRWLEEHQGEAETDAPGEGEQNPRDLDETKDGPENENGGEGEEQPLTVPPVEKGGNEEERAGSNASVPAVLKTAGLLRGVVFDPDTPGRNARFEPAIPQLEVAAQPERLPDVDDQTEGLLNALIGECHFLMREVAFPSMCHAGVADDRRAWLSKAMDLAKTGAGVAKAVARLRHGPKIRESRQTVVVENKVVAMAQGGGG